MGRLFGTDGVRGVANRELTPELAFQLGRAAGALLLRRRDGSPGRPKVLVGRDTRASGPMLEAALVSGFNSAGVDCFSAGVVPTPGVAYLVRSRGFEAGAVISASHNPVVDNGIKFFASSGYKFSDEEENEIERLVDELRQGRDALPRPTGGEVGTSSPALSLAGEYAAYLKGRFGLDLSGMRIVLDCANGAASALAPELFRSLGAEVIALHTEPDGVNINVECGSTHPRVLQEAVVREKADAGFTFDGDADRVLAVDGEGGLLDGDHILVALAVEKARRGALPQGRIAVTAYSNMGLRVALASEGIGVVETPAGDRFVLEAMRREGLSLGGEQSGHVILLEHQTTGDGMLTALALLDAARRSGAPLSALRALMRPFPQVLENVRVQRKEAWKENARVLEAIARGEEALGERGRLFVRASGTEPLVRIMGEGENEEQVRRVVAAVAEVIRAELG